MSAPSLEYYIEIAKNLNMTIAARKLHVSQQSLSAYIQRLESYYGVNLLERKPSLRLTRAGELVFQAAEQIEKTHDKLLDELGRLVSGSGYRETVSIGIFRPNANMLLNYFPMVEFNKRYPMISYTITEESNHILRDMLWHGKLDLIISSYTPTSVFHEFEEIPLYNDNENVLISDNLLMRSFPDGYPACIERFNQGVHLSDLHHIPMLMYPAASHSNEIIENYFRDNGLEYSVVGESPDRFLTNMIVQSQVAMGFCSDFFLRFLKKANSIGLPESIHAFPVIEPDMQRTVGILYQKKESYPEYFSELIEMTRMYNAG